MDTQTEHGLSGRRVLLFGEDTPLVRALRAVAAANGLEVTFTQDPDAPADVALHLAPQRASRQLEEALGEIERVQDSIGYAQRQELPLLLVGTLAVHGEREGALFEAEPTRTPFPRAASGGARGWQPDAELAAVRRRLEQTRARAGHADVKSRAIADAKAALLENKEPTRGSALADATEEERAAFVASALEQAGEERAKGWGFTSVHGYASALAEQLLAKSGVRSSIVRLATLSAPLAIEVERPFAAGEPAPLSSWARAARTEPVSAPSSGQLDLLPLDLAAEAVLITLAALLKGSAPPVVHASVAASNALTIARASDLIDLASRRRPAAGSRPGSPWSQTLRRVLEAAAQGVATRRAMLEPEVIVWSQKQQLRARALSDMQRQLFGREGPRPFDPAVIEWRRYLLDRHLPAALAHDEENAHRARPAPLRPFDHLAALLEEGAERYRGKPALSLFEAKERKDTSYQELYARARAVARRLEDAGVDKGDRVLLSGANHPDWGICCFGVLLRGAIVVPLDPALSPEQASNIARKAEAKLAILDDKARKAFGAALEEDAWDLHLGAVSGPPGATAPELCGDDVACILFTSGTTGDPKGVMLTHRNFTSLIASLGHVFDVHGDDRLLSVLPLHHTFELTCGMFLPLMAGGQVFYLDEVNGERLLYALREGRVTAMVGVPALWQLLERRLQKQIEARGPALKSAFDASLGLNRKVAERFGKDGGKLLFRAVHEELGGHLRTLISGGAALPADVHRLFHGLGLPIAEGYGLTEAAPVLTVAEPVPGAPPGTVGRPVPGVEIKIRDPDDKGVGEVLARGPNIMKGYFRDEAATRSVLDEEGWLSTGDLGFLDETGRLSLVGRAKEVVVTAAGENVYLDDVEARLGTVPHIGELSLLGLPDKRGGERLALVYVASKGVESTLARRSLEDALLKLPTVFRPAVVRPWPSGELPRTATLKVKRKDVRARLEELLREEPSGAGGEVAPPFAAVRGALALVAGVDVKSLTSGTDIAADLGFDSLMWVELQEALASLAGAIDAEALFRCRTVAELEAFVRQQAQQAPGARKHRAEDVAPAAQTLQLPRVAKAPARKALSFVQRELYRSLYDTEVTGRSHIPQNRSCIVVANHTSHLDTGLVKFALGRYGEGLTPLAARDYFFAGHPLKVAFFENLTNLRPIDRETGSGKSFEQAVAAVNEGNVVLIFPEGTRREDGTLGDFKPLVGRLSLTTHVDVLPLYLEGAYDAFPKGASVPRPGKLKVSIGPPLEARELARLTSHLPPVKAARASSALIREAVVALKAGGALELSRVAALDEEGRRMERDPIATPRSSGVERG